MAEQSVGMTSGSGDGTAGGYINTRMTAMQYKGGANGISLSRTGMSLQLSGTGSSTLTIADGSAYVGGFFYENTTSLNISVSTVLSGTYFVLIRVNDTASNVTVIRSASGTAITARTVRACVADTASYNQSTDVILGTITISGGVISALSRASAQYAVSTSVATDVSVSASKYSTQTLTTALTQYLVAFEAMSTDNWGMIVGDAASDTFTVNVNARYIVMGSLTVSATSLVSDAIDLEIKVGAVRKWRQSYKALCWGGTAGTDLILPISGYLNMNAGDTFSLYATAAQNNVIITATEIIIKRS